MSNCTVMCSNVGTWPATVRHVQCSL